MILVFVTLGLIVGSFLNVVVYRLNVAEGFVEEGQMPLKNDQWYLYRFDFVLLKFRYRCKEKNFFPVSVGEFSPGLSPH
jgi:prepilin signal peptidase PulO-like enzyme (type II secretory pathway)